MKLPEPFTYFVDRSLGREVVVEALRAAGEQVHAHGDLTAAAMGTLFVGCLPRIRRIVRRFEVPLAASLSTGGGIRVLLAAGAWLQPPREIK